MSRELPLFPRGEYAFDFDARDMAYQYTWVKRVNSTTQAGTGMGKVALGVCPAGGRAFGVSQQNGAKGDAANVMTLGVSLAKISTSAAAGKADDELAVGDNGCLVKATGGAWIVAVADEDYQPGDITTVTVQCLGKSA